MLLTQQVINHVAKSRNDADRLVTTNQDYMTHVYGAAEWLTTDKRPGLLLMGGVGCGKTTLLESICRLINRVYMSALSTERRGFVWDTAATIVNRPVDYDMYRTTEWLAVDDMGQEPAEVQEYGNVRYPIRDILLYRYEMGMPTIITTNLTADKIRERYGERLADRMREQYRVELFTNKSFR